VDNSEGHHVDPAGHALPPCIVMERGEALDVWSARNAPDRAQVFTVRSFSCLLSANDTLRERYETVQHVMQVMYHIAQRMAEFHAAGYVHRDLKPGNVMWLPRTNRWTVIDFGCAAQQGCGPPPVSVTSACVYHGSFSACPLIHACIDSCLLLARLPAAVPGPR
jgi:serine/threonine protein kinase